jgi:hypothetical protein
MRAREPVNWFLEVICPDGKDRKKGPILYVGRVVKPVRGRARASLGHHRHVGLPAQGVKGARNLNVLGCSTLVSGRAA